MNRFKGYREKANLTQQQLAEKMEITQKSITKWETGKGYPRADKLPTLANALGCTIDELFDEKQNPGG